MAAGCHSHCWRCYHKHISVDVCKCEALLVQQPDLEPYTVSYSLWPDMGDRCSNARAHQSRLPAITAVQPTPHDCSCGHVVS